MHYLNRYKNQVSNDKVSQHRSRIDGVPCVVTTRQDIPELSGCLGEAGYSLLIPQRAERVSLKDVVSPQLGVAGRI